MPSQTAVEVTGFAHCRNPMCQGGAQQEVAAVQTTIVYSFKDNGGDLDFPERSTTRLNFADDADRACPVCSLEREVTAEPRRSYEPLSGFPQNGLLQQAKFTGEPAAGDDRVAELERQLADLTDLIKKQAA